MKYKLYDFCPAEKMVGASLEKEFATFLADYQIWIEGAYYSILLAILAFIKHQYPHISILSGAFNSLKYFSFTTKFSAILPPILGSL